MARLETERRVEAGWMLPGAHPRPVPAAGRRAHWGAWLFLILAAGLLALAAALGTAFYEYHFANLIYPGVEMAGIPLGNMTLDEASQAIQDALTPYPGQPIVLRYETQRWVLSPADLGVGVDAQASAAQAFSVGRRHGSSQPGQGLSAYITGQWQAFWSDLSDQWSALCFDRIITPTISVNEGLADYQLLHIAQEVNEAPEEGLLTISGLDVIATPGRAGRMMDIDSTRAALLAAVRAGNGGDVDLVVRQMPPLVTSVDQAAAKATALLSQPLTLSVASQGDTQHFAVDRATLRQWLQITPVGQPDGSVQLGIQIKQDYVDEYLKGIADQVNHPVHDALLDFDDTTQQLKVVAPSQVGEELDLAGSTQVISAALLSGQRQITLPLTIRQPAIDMNKIGEMGITELVSEATTGFAGSTSGRVHNIINAASKLNNAVVAPGQEFSFDKYVGDVTMANGFVDSLIIAGDRTEVGIGGGVCQVSTTIFQAAARGGFPITARTPHSYVVGYYGKPGLDATIYTPDVDFRFVNDTGHYLLIKTEVNTERSQLTFRFYGTRPNRTVEISDPTITNVTPPLKSLYQEDATLGPGIIRQVDYANSGEDVVVTRTIDNANGTVKQDQFVSHYQPWRAVYLYGPGTELPAGALDSTP